MSIVEAMEKRMALGPLDDSWYTPGGSFYGGTGIATKAGSNVSEMNAMKLAVVWCCIRILSEDTASLPLILYRRISSKSGKYGGKERATNHPLYHLMHTQPNPEMSSMTFRESYNAHIVSWGNGYAEKEYGKGLIGRNRIEALWPIAPHRVTPYREKRQLKYKISMPNGIPNVVLPRKLMLHIPGLSYDGIIGYSPIAAAREAIGMGMALESFGGEYFGNGIHPSIVITHAGTLKNPADLRKAINELYSGLGKHHRAMLIEDATKIEKIAIPNNEAQFLETRKFQNVDIGTRIYRVPPYMYGEMDKTAFANVEQQAIDYVTKTLRPWLVRIEQGYNISFLTPEEQKEYFFEHLVDGLLRGDMKSRFEAYSIAKSARIYATNEIREIENRNPIEGGDKLDENPNMMPAGKSKEENAVRISNAYKKIFQFTAQRIVNRETLAIKKVLKAKGTEDLSDWLDKFYRDSETYIKEQIEPIISSYFEAIDEENSLDIDKAVADFTRRYVEQSKSAMKLLLVSPGKDEIEGKIKAKIDDWAANRAAEIAENETKTGGKPHETDK